MLLNALTTASPCDVAHVEWSDPGHITAIVRPDKPEVRQPQQQSSSGPQVNLLAGDRTLNRMDGALEVLPGPSAGPRTPTPRSRAAPLVPCLRELLPLAGRSRRSLGFRQTVSRAPWISGPVTSATAPGTSAKEASEAGARSARVRQQD